MFISCHFAVLTLLTNIDTLVVASQLLPDPSFSESDYGNQMVGYCFKTVVSATPGRLAPPLISNCGRIPSGNLCAKNAAGQHNLLSLLCRKALLAPDFTTGPSTMIVDDQPAANAQDRPAVNVVTFDAHRNPGQAYRTLPRGNNRVIGIISLLLSLVH